ncbi:MAG: serine hydrolase [Lysinibacillus sp.]
MKKLLFVSVVLIGIYFYFSKEGAVSGSLQIDSINSQNAVLFDEQGDVYYTKNADEKIYPASLTKIMTAILAIEHVDLQQTIKIKEETINNLLAQKASMAGFSAGDEIKMQDLLYGTLLASGADATIALTEQVKGSEEAFVVLMNEKAQQLGMDSTHFTNATGLHNKNHYSTVNDLSVLLRYALENTTFKHIFTTKHYVTAPTTHFSEGITINSTLFSKLEGETINGGNLLGGKTGYTPEAGLCLASMAEINGENYLFITVNAPGHVWSEPLHIKDAVYVYNQLQGE